MNNCFKPAVFLISVALAACTTTDPNSGEQKASNTAKGAGLGAVAGALIGVATSNKSGRAKGVLTGAAAGAALGGGAGYVMDRQEQKLRERMAQTSAANSVRLERSGDSLNVVMPGDVSFDVGQSLVKPSFAPALDAVAESLNENPSSHVSVYGHTDSTGSYATNIKLSQSRAQAVSNYLQSRGVATSRFNVVAVGPDNPLADNSTAEGRAKNRRVEIKITPSAQQG